MNKRTPIQLSIPSPCGKDWNKMTPVDKGRFCSHCQKSVVDFTSWTDKDLYQYIDNNRDQDICGRVRASQLNRDIIYPEQRPTKFYRIAVGLGLVLLFSQAPDILALPRAPLIVQTDVIESNENKTQSKSDSIIITGQVLDKEENPIAGATVRLHRKRKHFEECETEANGIFTFKMSAKRYSKAILNVKYLDYAEIYEMIDLKNLKSSYQIRMLHCYETFSIGQVYIPRNGTAK